MFRWLDLGAVHGLCSILNLSEGVLEFKKFDDKKYFEASSFASIADPQSSSWYPSQNGHGGVVTSSAASPFMNENSILRWISSKNLRLKLNLFVPFKALFRLLMGQAEAQSRKKVIWSFPTEHPREMSKQWECIRNFHQTLSKCMFYSQHRKL